MKSMLKMPKIRVKPPKMAIYFLRAAKQVEKVQAAMRGIVDSEATEKEKAKALEKMTKQMTRRAKVRLNNLVLGVVLGRIFWIAGV
jgi:hypothetical protein